MRLAQKQLASEWQSPTYLVLYVMVAKPNRDILIINKRVSEDGLVIGMEHGSIFYGEGNVLYLHTDVNYAIANTGQSLLSCIADMCISFMQVRLQ